MKLSNARQIWIVVVVLALAALACGGGAEPTATALPRPTQKPNSTATEAAPDPTATRPAPKPTATEAEVEPTQTTGSGLVLSETPYDHPSGAFSMTLPQDWEIDEKNNSVFVTSPDNVVAIEVSFTNVGQPLSEDELGTFIQAVEDNWFATFDNYTPGDFEPQSDGSIGVFKTLDLSSGTPQSVFSYYWQEDGIVFEQDFWVDTDQYDTYVDGLVEVANSMDTDAAAGADADPYAIVYTFTSPEKLFEIDMPYPWKYERDDLSGGPADRFTSPDGQSSIENIFYSSETEIVQTVDELATTWLKDYLSIRSGVSDLVITDEQVQADGSLRQTWSSASEAIEGEAFFEVRGNDFLILLWLVNSSDYETFAPVWATVVDSYTIPEP